MCSNQGKGVAPSSTPRCSSYWEGSLQVALDYGRPIYLIYIYWFYAYSDNKIELLFVHLCGSYLNFIYYYASISHRRELVLWVRGRLQDSAVHFSWSFSFLLIILILFIIIPGEYERQLQFVRQNLPYLKKYPKSSSSCRTASMDFPDPLSPPVSIETLTHIYPSIPIIKQGPVIVYACGFSGCILS